jgi:hypothetical protein
LVKILWKHTRIEKFEHRGNRRYATKTIVQQLLFLEVPMNCRKLFAPAVIASIGLAAAVGSMVLAEASKDAKPAGQPELKLPPGWTQADVQACMVAGTPGNMHEHLAKGAGGWNGKNTMWMVPGGEPMVSDSTTTVTPIMDGRFVKVETKGEMPGMGPYHGVGIYGFDNVSQKFISTWIDNHSTGIMTGTGELSPDGKTLTWKYSFNCPITKKPSVMREIETITGPDTKMLEMFSADPKSGKEFKMMSIELTKKS